MAERLVSFTEIARVLEDLPVIVRSVRRARRLSLREMADQSGVSFNTITRLEHGAACSIRSAAALLLWLDEAPAPVPEVA